MTSYQIVIESSAARAVRRLPGHVRQRVRRSITELGIQPRPPGSRPLRNQTDYHRLRLDGWRIIYMVDDDARLVTVIAVKRKTGPETYTGLS